MATQRYMYDMDIRIIARNVQNGKVSRKEYNKYIQSLPDVADKGVAINEPQPLEPKTAQSEA